MIPSYWCDFLAHYYYKLKVPYIFTVNFHFSHDTNTMSTFMKWKNTFTVHLPNEMSHSPKQSRQYVISAKVRSESSQVNTAASKQQKTQNKFSHLKLTARRETTQSGELPKQKVRIYLQHMHISKSCFTRTLLPPRL